MYIIIGADFVPTNSNTDLFINGDTTALVGDELKLLLDEASYRIFNLEIPLTDRTSPIMKEGPNLIAPTDTVEGYRALGVNLLTLANNHILDQDVQGLQSTVESLDSVGICHVGTGDDLNSAASPYIFSFNDKRIGVYACVEHEFSVAEEEKPGANPFDPLYSFDDVSDLRNKTDYVIVLYHGGKEHYRYPSPMLQKVCRRFIDKGANIVLCQHSHCIGCEEKYKDGTIIYGQGNFIFDDSDDECWQTSMLVKIDESFKISYVPLAKSGNGVRLADKQQGQEILKEFSLRSEEVKQPGFVERQYKQFADTYLDFYLRAISGRKSLWFRVLNKLSGGYYTSWYLRRTYRKMNNVKISNYIDCEAHRELFSQAILNSYNCGGETQ